jgi:hypothetical protein
MFSEVVGALIQKCHLNCQETDLSITEEIWSVVLANSLNAFIVRASSGKHLSLPKTSFDS